MLLEEAIAQNKIKPGQTIMVQPIGKNYIFTGKVKAIQNNESFGGMEVDLFWCRDNTGYQYNHSKFIPSVTNYKVIRINGRFA